MKNYNLKKHQASVNCLNSKKQEMRITYRDLNYAYAPDHFCITLWEYAMPDWMPDNLRAEMVDALRGFNEDMALEIADNLIDCWTGFGLHVTGIDHVDELLGKLYMRILSYVHRNGIKLLYSNKI